MPDLSGDAFLSEDVCRFYVHRPPYATQALECLVQRAPATNRLLDLGCGEGKLARPLATHFDQVVAVDPSPNMIRLGKSLENGRAKNIEWLQAKAEHVQLGGKFDVVTFASSIHWMDPTPLFMKLRPHLSADGMLAIVSGDEAFAPPWGSDWCEFLKKWVPVASGLPVGSQAWSAIRERYKDYVELGDHVAFVSEPIRQSVESFVLCQHARNTFALDKLRDRTTEFRDELAELLRPYADGSGVLTFSVKTQVQFAKPRLRPRRS